MSIVIDGKELMWLRDAALKAGVPYITLYSWLRRHPDFPRTRVNHLIFVAWSDVEQFVKSK